MYMFLLMGVACDQMTKYLARIWGPSVLTSFFSITKTWNPGISWGLFPCHTNFCRWALIVGECVVLVIIYRWYKKSHSLWERRGILCIATGACGNMLDRIFFGSIFDFLDLHWNTWHFPAFNVADIFISIGFLILMKESLWSQKQKSF